MNQASRELLHNLRCDVPCSVTLTEEEWNYIKANFGGAMHVGYERKESDLESFRALKGWKRLED